MRPDEFDALRPSGARRAQPATTPPSRSFGGVGSGDIYAPDVVRTEPAMKNQLKTLALFGGLTAVLVGLGAAIGPGYMYGALLIALVMNAGAYFFSDQLVLRMNGAQVVSRGEAPELYALVEELAGRANLPMPQVAIVEDPTPNAFATGRNPERGVVAVTTGILGLLSRRELRGVIAHELAHIQNRDILLQSVAAVIASGISGIGNLLMFLPFLGSGDDEDAPNPVAALALAIVAPVAATLIQFGISRSREYLADETGARISGDPEALASALTKLKHGHQRAAGATTAEPATASLFIVNPFAGVEVAQWFSTHPSTEDRVQRLRTMGVRRVPAHALRRAS